MKKSYLLFICLILSLFLTKVIAQTEWTGPITTVTKANFADWTLPENQDMLTPNVILTRADNRGIFNIAQENMYSSSTSPSDTEWTIGTIADGIDTLTFDTWDNTHDGNPPSIVNIDLVLHLITDNIYIDIKITDWTSGDDGGGGGFTYERSTDQSLGINENTLNDRIELFPNPSTEFINLTGLSSAEKYTIYNILGSEISQGTISNREKINIKNFVNGIYFLKLNNGTTIKFLKK